MNRDSARRLFANPANQLTGLLAAAVVFGGGGVAYGLANLCVQLAALAIIGWNRKAILGFFGNGPKGLAALVLTSTALPLAQMIPLPPGVWTALPGRELVSEALALTGANGWFPFSVDSARTLVAFLGTLAPLTIICLGCAIPSAELDRLQRVAVMLGLGCALFGMVQVLGNDIAIPYPENPMPGVLLGTFANRNSTGLFLVCSLLMLVAWPLPRLAAKPVGLRLGTGVVMVLGVLFTQSRSSVALLLLPAALLAVRLACAWFGSRKAARSWLNDRSRLLICAIALFSCTAAGIAAVQLAGSGRIGIGLSRFSDLTDQRPQIWEDAAFSAKRFWPAGSGMGTFDEVFQVDESLEYISSRRAGRAHNDYLELAIEAGAAGLLLAACWLAWSIAATILSLRARERWPALGAAGVIAAIALQSVVDYPLRNQTMLCVAALAIVLLARSSQAAKGPTS